MKKTILGISAVLVLLSFSAALSFAVENVDMLTSEAMLAQRAPVISFGYLMQVFFSLLIVAAFLYLTAKYALPKLKVAGAGKMIEVMDRVGLEPQVTAYVLKVGSRSWLVVSSNKNVQLISELEESDQVGSPKQ